MDHEYSHRSAEWYTPRPIIDALHRVWGGIRLDPCSCPLAQETVRAGTAYYESGLYRPWDVYGTGGILVNPPGAVDTDTRGAGPTAWWRQAVTQDSDTLYVMFSINHLQVMQSHGWRDDAIVVIPRRRIAYDTVRGGVRVRGPAPPKPSALVTWGPASARLAIALAGIDGGLVLEGGRV